MLAVGGGVERAARLEHAAHLGDGLRAVRDVIEHVVGDHGVEARIRVRDRLRVDLLEAEFVRDLRQRPPLLVQHPRREIRQRDLPARRDALAVSQPEPARARPQFENPRLRRKLVQVEHPLEPTVGIAAERRMQICPRRQPRGIFILIVLEIVRIRCGHWLSPFVKHQIITQPSTRTFVQQINPR